MHYFYHRVFLYEVYISVRRTCMCLVILSCHLVLTYVRMCVCVCMMCPEIRPRKSRFPEENNTVWYFWNDVTCCDEMWHMRTCGFSGHLLCCQTVHKRLVICEPNRKIEPKNRLFGVVQIARNWTTYLYIYFRTPFLDFLLCVLL